MWKLKTRSLTLPRYLHFPLLLVFLGTPILAILVSLWWLQQTNVNFLDQEIENFETKIKGLQLTIEVKNKLEPQVTSLEQKIETLPKNVASKQQLINQLNKLRKLIATLPDSIISEERFLTREKERLTLEKERVNAQNAIYRSLIQALGGLFFSITAYLTWRNIKATEDKQITERFSKAVEQLGSGKIEVRLGGIYSLERIAIDSAKDHWTIMEILTSFVQEKSSSLISLQKQKGSLAERYLTKKKESETQEHDLSPVSKDVQAAITVIGRRDYQKEQGEEKRILDLSSTNLTQVYLTGANLQGVHLEKANLTGIHLERANLEGANLKGANLEGANLEGANLEGANLEGANLKNAHLWIAHLEGTNLNRADLENANLRGTNLKNACFDHTNRKGMLDDGAKNIPSDLQK